MADEPSCSVAAALVPPQAWSPPARVAGLAALFARSPLFFLRDLFVMSVGCVAVYFVLGETSAFTDAARALKARVLELELPNALLELELAGYLERTDIAFTINGIPITRALFVSFVQLCATLVTYFTLFVNADLFDEEVSGGGEGA